MGESLFQIVNLLSLMIEKVARSSPITRYLCEQAS